LIINFFPENFGLKLRFIKSIPDLGPAAGEADAGGARVLQRAALADPAAVVVVVVVVGDHVARDQLEVVGETLLSTPQSVLNFSEGMSIFQSFY
jgi:hypothetical protein